MPGRIWPRMLSDKDSRVSRSRVSGDSADLPRGMIIDKQSFSIHSISMPVVPMPKGALSLLILRVLQRGPLHGYAIAQRIGQLSGDVLAAEEGSLYPALQRILVEGWVAAEWGVSESGRRVRFYKLTADGKAQLKREMHEYERTTAAIQAILRLA
jgi:PadR family transcriptional regulator PadR